MCVRPSLAKFVIFMYILKTLAKNWLAPQSLPPPPRVKNDIFYLLSRERLAEMIYNDLYIFCWSNWNGTFNTEMIILHCTPWMDVAIVKKNSLPGFRFNRYWNLSSLLSSLAPGDKFQCLTGLHVVTFKYHCKCWTMNSKLRFLLISA